MVKFSCWIISLILSVIDFHAVCGNCSGGVTSQTVSYGESGMSELMLPSEIRSIRCTWEVKSNTNGLRLDLENVIIPQSDNCQQGYMQITVGEYGKFDSVSLDKWCGEFYPRSIYVSGHVMIRFHLLHTTSRVGIKVRYTSVQPTEFCPTPPRNLTGSGYIYSPGYGGHWSEAPPLSCDWQLEAAPGHVIQIELMHVDFSEWACSRQQAKLVAYDGNALLNQIGSWCTTNLLNVVKSTRSGLHLTYVNRVPHRGSGFIVKYYQVPDYHSDCAPYVRDVIARRTPSFIRINQFPNQGRSSCRWNITAERENEVVVMETEYYDLGRLGCSYVELSYFDGPGVSPGDLQSRLCAGRKLPSQSVIQSSGRHAFINMKYNSLSQSVEAVRALIRVFSVPKVPCWKKHKTYTADESLSRVWIPVDNTKQLSDCDIRIQSSTPNTCIRIEVTTKSNDTLSLYDYFQIHDGSNMSASVYQSRCSPTGKSYTYSTGPDLLLVRQLSPLESHVTLPNIDGFWLAYTSVSSCDIGDYTVIKADIEQFRPLLIPPAQYNSNNSNQLCRYAITSGSGTVLQLYLSDQSMANSSYSNCNESTASISDGIDGQDEIGWWCEGRSAEYVSYRNKVYVAYMKKGNTTSQDRLTTVYYRARIIEQCHQSYLAPEGSPLTFSSPYYPRFYPNHASCSWKITASRSNYRVEIQMREMSIETGYNSTCDRDYLAFYDGPSATYREIKRYCGRTVDTRLFRSSGMHVYAEFHSNGDTSAMGFKATYKSVKLFKCNETLHASDEDGPQHFISSPYFPNHYGDNLACYWLIEAAESHVIQTEMALAEFTGSHSTCSGDFLAFYDGKDESAPLLGRVCGIELPQYRSSGRNMYIVFQSNGDKVTARGFQLQFYSVFLYKSCQSGSVGRLKGNTTKAGHLTSPFYPRGFPAGLSCQWRVSVSPGYQVKLTVDEAFLVNDCNMFQVKFYDGPIPKESVLGTWCGEPDRSYESSEDTMYIAFHSNIRTRTGFKLSYKATGSALSRSSTALIVGVIIASIVVVVVIASIVVCCCCCCKERKKTKESPESESDSTGGKKKASQPLINNSYICAKESKPAIGSLVPTAPPMELDNPGFQFGDDQFRIPHSDDKPQPLYPALPSVNDLPKSVNVTEHLLQRPRLHERREDNAYHDGQCYREKMFQQRKQTGNQQQHVREVSLTQREVLVSHQRHLGNSYSPENIIHLADVEPRLFQSSKVGDNTQSGPEEPNHQHERQIELTQENGQIRQEVDFAQMQSRSSSYHDQMRSIDIIYYGGGNGEHQAKKGKKKKTKTKNKKGKNKDTEEKIIEPLKVCLKKLSSIECGEMEIDHEPYDLPVPHALQERHQMQAPYPPGSLSRQTDEPLSNVPFVLSPNAYLTSPSQDFVPQSWPGNRFPDQPHQNALWLNGHDVHQQRCTRPDDSHRVIHAEVHSGTPDVLGQYQRSNQSGSDPSVPRLHDTLYRPNDDRWETGMDAKMYPVLNDISSAANPRRIWSTDQRMVKPHIYPQLDDVERSEEQSVWHQPPVTAAINFVPMLVPIPDAPEPLTGENRDSDDCQMSPSLEVDEMTIQDDMANCDNCPSSTSSHGVISDGEPNICLQALEHPTPPDPLKLNSILPPPHWISEGMSPNCTDAHVDENHPVSVNIPTTETAFKTDVQSETPPSQCITSPEDDSEPECNPYSDKDSTDVEEGTLETRTPELLTSGCEYQPSSEFRPALSPKTGDQIRNGHIQTVTASDEVFTPLNDNNTTGTNSEHRNQSDAEVSGSFQFNALIESSGSDLLNVELDSGEDDIKNEQQKKLEILLQRGFTENEVEDMDETVV